MQIFRDTAVLQDHIKGVKNTGRSIGFVPTMGALHKGHLSLLEISRKHSSYSVVSIFVNPTQFNNQEDFRNYPIQPDKDFALLSEAGCDAVFIPTTDEIYPAGSNSLPLYDLGFLENIMEGKFRPGHFQGVCQVVDRLLEIVTPDYLFLGQKDLQQCKVIEKLLEIKGKKGKVKLIICPTVREQDGLAMSSRNQRLTESERIKSVAIFNALSELKNIYGKGSLSENIEKCRKELEKAGIRVEYLELVNTDTLEILNEWPDHDSMISCSVCIAAYLGKIRLIDNMILHSIK
jgi:pantoate--beta-alanine ligase